MKQPSSAVVLLRRAVSMCTGVVHAQEPPVVGNAFTCHGYLVVDAGPADDDGGFGFDFEFNRRRRQAANQTPRHRPDESPVGRKVPSEPFRRR